MSVRPSRPSPTSDAASTLRLLISADFPEPDDTALPDVLKTTSSQHLEQLKTSVAHNPSRLVVSSAIPRIPVNDKKNGATLFFFPQPLCFLKKVAVYSPFSYSEHISIQTNTHTTCKKKRYRTNPILIQHRKKV